MFKFRKPGTRMDSEARRLLQNELFAFRRTVTHGFPHRPSALAFDPILRLDVTNLQLFDNDELTISMKQGRVYTHARDECGSARSVL